MEKQPGMVSFVGAGPGDPELLTLKGKRLIEEAALLLYAGSMIPPALLDLASPRASVIDAAPLDLEECHSLMLQFARAGQPVVHLHTGDPAVYSALREQLALLDRDGIPWQVVPGITAASAAAAAAGCSFTVPGATQSLIMTRMPGRTPMPEQEALRHLAKHGTTLAVYLSAMQARAMQEELEQSLPAATPVICAFRLGWPDQQLIRTRLDLLAETIEKNGLSRQTVVLVLPGEGEDAPVPRTCGPHTDHACRARGKRPGPFPDHSSFRLPSHPSPAMHGSALWPRPCPACAAYVEGTHAPRPQDAPLFTIPHFIPQCLQAAKSLGKLALSIIPQQECRNIMPTPILEKESLIPGKTSKLVLHAPAIASHARPGHFVMLRMSPTGERIPLTIADTDAEKGTITIVYLVMGKSTAILEDLKAGDEILDVCGPLGKPTHIEKKGTVICVGGGTGIAAMHHIAKGHSRIGNKVVGIIGARNKDLLLFEKELASFVDELLISTDDGSYGHKGLVTDLLRDRLESDKDVFEVVAVGPVPMMAAVANTTRPYGVRTTVSLNPIMVDGIGMCGACRVTVDGKTKFACVDGPEFDGHKVDFDELRRRLGAYRDQEKVSIDQYRSTHGN